MHGQQPVDDVVDDAARPLVADGEVTPQQTVDAGEDDGAGDDGQSAAGGVRVGEDVGRDGGQHGPAHQPSREAGHVLEQRACAVHARRRRLRVRVDGRLQADPGGRRTVQTEGVALEDEGDEEDAGIAEQRQYGGGRDGRAQSAGRRRNGAVAEQGLPSVIEGVQRCPSQSVLAQELFALGPLDDLPSQVGEVELVRVGGRHDEQRHATEGVLVQRVAVVRPYFLERLDLRHHIRVVVLRHLAVEVGEQKERVLAVAEHGRDRHVRPGHVATRRRDDVGVKRHRPVEDGIVELRQVPQVQLRVL